MAKFHHYSVNNVILIAMQMPTASLVAGYTSWRDKFHRQVKKGEKGIRILAPAPYKRKVSAPVVDGNGQPVMDAAGKQQREEKEVTIQSFRPVSVFDVSQTEGEPLPELGVHELTDSVEDYRRMESALLNSSPVPIIFWQMEGSAKGCYDRSTDEIHVQDGMSEAQTIKTMIHEISHATLHSKSYEEQHPDEPKKDRHTKEVEAESIAYVVCSHYGIDTSDYSFGYVAGWSSGKRRRSSRHR